MRPPELENWRPRVRNDQPKPLTHTHEYLEAKVCHHWNLKPWEFRSLEPVQKGELFAIWMVEKECEEYFHDETMRISESKEDQRKAKDGVIKRDYSKRR